MSETEYRHGDRVEDTRTGLTGTVVAPATGPTQVWWDGLPVDDADALGDVTGHIRPMNPQLPFLTS